MTNTGNTLITQPTGTGRNHAMQSYIDYQQALVRTRIHDLEGEAAATRLAAGDRARAPGLGLRVRIGLALIRAGEAIAPERKPRRHVSGRPSAIA
jgi:hypothetical protein